MHPDPNSDNQNIADPNSNGDPISHTNPGYAGQLNLTPNKFGSINLASHTETLKEPLPNTLEKQNSIETLTPQTRPTEDIKDVQKIELPKTIEVKPNVVHKESGPVQLHKVHTSADSLTSLADKEEEDFIQHVVDAHKPK